jgi:hypothetical protein
MPDKIKKPKKKSSDWSVVRSYLANMEKPGLLSLVKDLYDGAAENRDFIEARRLPEDSGVVLETYRHRVVEQFLPSRAEARQKLGEARRPIRDTVPV